MTIPEVRKALLALANKLMHPALTSHDTAQIAWEIGQLVNELHRRKPIKVAPSKGIRVTKREILEMREEFPEWSQQDTAAFLGITAGRVSEAERGKRT